MQHPWRIAILIFFVGASVVNALLAKSAYDRIGEPTPAPSASPTPNSFFPSAARGLTWGTPATPDPWAVDVYGAASIAYQRRQATDKALVAEAVLVTIAGVAWFLIPKTNPA
jgi:hypothetical protein